MDAAAEFDQVLTALDRRLGGRAGRCESDADRHRQRQANQARFHHHPSG